MAKNQHSKAALDAMSSKELVEIYNVYAPRPLKGWDKAKSILVERIIQLQMQSPEDPVAPAPEAPKRTRKEKAPKEPSGPSKWEQMLEALDKRGPLTVQELAEAIDSSVGSVGCYLNYFRTGKRGIPVAAISKQKVEDRGYVYKLDEKLSTVMARVAD